MRKNKPKYLFQTIQFLPSPSIQPKHQTPQWNVRWIGSNPRHVHIGASLTENTTIARRSPIINQFSPRSLWPRVLNLPGVGSFSCAEDLIDRQREGERVGTRKRSNDDRIPGCVLHRYNNPWYPRPCYSTCRAHQGGVRC